jgi:ATP-dependent RNA helicase DeaD
MVQSILTKKKESRKGAKPLSAKPSRKLEIPQAFTGLNISQEVLRAIAHMGFSEVTPVQQECIPRMMAGEDIIGIAPTGTGKTCAFGIPMLEYISLTDTRVQELVLCPTRELAQQIAEELTQLARYIPEIRIAVIYGGQNMTKQLAQLRRQPQILVATPGRLLDHMQRGNISLADVHTMVLDEADEMLKMGFVKDVSKIIESTPPDRQLVMFSATTNPDVMTIAWKYQQNPAEIVIPATEESKPDITQYVIDSDRARKYDHLLYLLDSDQYKRVMVFCNTKDMTGRLCARLQKAGYSADCLHGDIPQTKRNRVMSDFRKGRFEILVATDVAARGIDVDDVEAVMNYDIPDKNEYYLHRIGRTGRAKRAGVSFSFISFVDGVRLDEILKYVDAEPIALAFDSFGTLRYKESGEPFFEHI